MASGLMQPGPTLYEAEQQRKKKGSRGLLGEVGEPLSYAPGPVGLLGNAMLSAQYATGEKPMDEGLSALAMLTGLMQGTKVAPIMRNAIKVYHGSPHKFDKADSSKIGTGEGAQAYGHGLYWAENPDVAKNYSAAGQSVVPKEVKYKGKNADQWYAYFSRRMDANPNDREAQAGAYFWEHVASRQHPQAAINNALSDPSWPELHKYAKGIDAKDFKGIPDAHLYEASLRWPDPAREAADPLSAKHFLDWDKPLSEQGEVGRKLQEIFQKKAGSKWGGAPRSNSFGETVNGYEDIDYADTTGKDAYEYLLSLKAKHDAGLDGLIARSATSRFHGNNEASRYLRKLGIPGITYLDAGSRAAGEGTRNYVTFDDALVELLKRNGMGLLGK